MGMHNFIAIYTIVLFRSTIFWSMGATYDRAFIYDVCVYMFLSENRYLLFLTENYAALEILRHYLHDVVGSASPGDSALEGEGRPERMDPFVLFGSSFPKDKEYTQVKQCLCLTGHESCLPAAADLLNCSAVFSSNFVS